MSVEKNETAIQVLKILYSQQKKKKLKKTHYNKVYPRNIEAKYKTKLTNFYKPLVNFVDTFLQENQVQMLRGDSKEIKCDAMPGGTFRRMVQSLEGWVSVYMPTVAEMKEGQNNVIFMGLNQTAEQIKQHEDAQFQKQLQNGIGVSFQTNASWWPNTKASWAQNNYNLITSNARNYISQINTLCEQAVVNGYSVKQLQEQIKKASNGLTDKKCRLIARDQIGKLQGQVSQAQMEEVGLEMYVWETSGDERVRSTHIPMDGLLCRWDDANVYSADGGKHWIPRPANAVKMHPGQDIQCRCIAVAYMPELLYEVSGEPMESLEIPALSSPTDADTENITAPVPTTRNYTEEQLGKIQQEFENNLQLIEDEEIRKYIIKALNDISVSNTDTKVLFNKTMLKMSPPYFRFNDEIKNAHYNPTKKIIEFKNKFQLSKNRTLIHELGHAFSELNKKNGKPLSRQKTFTTALNKDYVALRMKHGNTDEKLNNFISQLVKKDVDSFGGIADIVGGKQNKKLFNLPGHGQEYWLEDEQRIFDEGFGNIFQIIFDKKSSKVVKDLFPESYNNIKKEIVLSVKGEL